MLDSDGDGSVNASDDDDDDDGLTDAANCTPLDSAHGDLATDSENCGECGVSCNAGVCIQGTCRCADALALCQGECIDPINEP